jgi:hypothetical protein
MAEEVENTTEVAEVNTIVAAPAVVGKKKIRGFWELIRASWEVFTQAWKKYLVFFLVVTAMTGLFVVAAFGLGALISYIETGGQTLDPNTFGSFGVVGIIGLLVLIPVSIALQLAIYRSLYSAAETAESVQDSIKYGFANLLAFFGVSILAGLMIFGATLLLIVPGIIVALMLSMYYPVFIVEGKRGMEVFRRSNELTKGYKWSLLGKYLLAFLLYIGASILVGILGSIVTLIPVVGVYVSSLLTQVLAFVFSPVLIIFGYFMYKDLSAN